MPLILKNRHDRFAFQFGCQSGLRSTDEVVDQLQEQLGRERAQHAFDLAEKENEIAIHLRELAQARLELARFESLRDRAESKYKPALNTKINESWRWNQPAVPYWSRRSCYQYTKEKAHLSCGAQGR